MAMDSPFIPLEKGLDEFVGNNRDDSGILCQGKGSNDKEAALCSESTLFQGHERKLIPRPPNYGILAACFVLVTVFFLYIGAPWAFCNPIQANAVTCRLLHHCNPHRTSPDDPLNDFSNVITRPQDLSDDSRILHEIPQYVLDYAPLVYLYSEEQFWPCDIAEHLFHVTPKLNYTPIQGRLQYSNLTNLDELNEFEKGRHVYLTSDDNVEQRPDWLEGEKNIPNKYAETEEIKDSGGSGARPDRMQKRSQSQGGRSNAPAVLITVNKGDGIVDAFWFYFYSYNLGNLVFNVRFGNHVGDWEHSLIRFEHGEPKLVFYSEHYFGQAYNYSAVEKIGKRPVVYSATGTHAMYATPGSHPYVLPLGILHDETDRGPLWDPALNSHMYTYNHLTDDLRPSNITPHAPTEWFYFNGHWGDRFYPLSDTRQYGLFGEYHYVSGPLGPRFKHLGRRNVCQGRFTDPCIIKDRLDTANEVREWPGLGEGEDWPDPEMRPPGLGDDDA